MKLPLLSGKQVLAALSRLGFVEAHRKGSHVKMKHAGRLIRRGSGLISSVGRLRLMN